MNLKSGSLCSIIVAKTNTLSTRKCILLSFSHMHKNNISKSNLDKQYYKARDRSKGKEKNRVVFYVMYKEASVNERR